MKKKKIWGAIARFAFAFMFIASWAVLGVALALKTAKIEIGGGITFTATDVYAKVSGSVTGTNSSNPIDEHPIEINATTSSDFTVDNSWTNMNLDFQSSNTPIVLTITIENLSDERNIYLLFEENITSTNVDFDRTQDGNEVDSFSIIEIPAKTESTSSSKTLSITLSVADKNQSASGTFKFIVTLSSDTTVFYPTLTFTQNDDGTLSVSKNSDNLPTGDLVIPSQIAYNNELCSVTSIGERAFCYCTGLTNITIPSSVTSIGESAFKDCTNLTNITIPSSVTSIGESVFQGCSGLTNITIPSSVTSIDRSAFSYCTGLTSITIPASVTSIDYYAFSYCTGLTSITIPASVTSIKRSVFNSCTGLTSINVESGNTVYHSNGNCLIETASKELIAGCKASVIPNDGSVTSIELSAFYGCTGLTSMTIPASVTSIGFEAFWGCSGLTSITIPSSVTSIGNSAFCRCTSLATITIDSDTISNALTSYSACGHLISYATTVYIKEGCSTSSSTYLTSNFTQTTSDQSGYVKWVKNS